MPPDCLLSKSSFSGIVENGTKSHKPVGRRHAVAGGKIAACLHQPEGIKIEERDPRVRGFTGRSKALATT